MAKQKTPADSAKAKQAKQKKIVIALVVVLALAVAYAGKTMIGLTSGGGTKPQAVVTVPSPATPAATPSAALPAAPTLAGSQGTASSSGTTTTPATASTQLVAAVQPSADTGQLQSFSRFATKDPFDTLGPKGGGTSASSGSGSSGSSGSSGGTKTTPATPPTPPAPPPTSAVISVNGIEWPVATGSDFPASAPLFQLMSLTATTAKVEIAGGSYASGQAALTLRVNKAVTLVNTADGTRYTLMLWPQGTVAPAAGSSSSSSSSSSTASSSSSDSTTPTSTTPTTTTPTTTTP
jgi:hypothetical protein